MERAGRRRCGEVERKWSRDLLLWSLRQEDDVGASARVSFCSSRAHKGLSASAASRWCGYGSVGRGMGNVMLFMREERRSELERLKHSARVWERTCRCCIACASCPLLACCFETWILQPS